MVALSEKQDALLRRRDTSSDRVDGNSQTEAGGFVDPLDAEGALRWDKWVGLRPDATIFHTSAWARVLAETYRYTPAYIVSGDENEPEALLPIMEVRSRITGSRGVSLPFTDECAALRPDGCSSASDSDALREYAQSRGWKSIEFRGEVKEDVRPSSTYYGHYLSLGPDEDAMFERLSSTARRNVRKAVREGVEVEAWDSMDGMKAYYRLHCLTRKRQGVPPQPYSFFENIQKHVVEKGHGFILLATQSGKTISGAVYLGFGTQSIYKFGASDFAYQNLRANVLVMWEAIKRLSAAGYETLSFGRTDLPHEGLRRFKMGFGPEERMIHYYKLDVRSGAFVENSSTVSGRYESVFRAMPVPVLRAVGAVLYRHMG